MTAPAGLETLQDMSQSGGAPHELALDQVTQLRQVLNESLFHFAWVIFGFHDLVSVHRDICNLLGAWGTRPGYDRLMIQVPRGSYKCQSPDDLAHTPDGPRPIGSLEPGDELASLDPSTFEPRLERVRAAEPARAPLLRLTFRSGLQAQVTPNHLLRVPTGWCQAAHLKPGDGVASPAFLPAPNPPRPPWPYWAGVLCGDGHLGWARDRRATPTLTCHDPEILEALGQEGVKFRRRPSHPHTFSFHKDQWERLPTSLWSKSWHKRIPEEYEGSAAFLRGLFDTDGHVYANGVLLTTVSEKLARGAQRNLRYFGIPASIRCDKTSGPNGYRSTAWKVEVSTQRSLSRFASAIGFSHRAKDQALKAHLDRLRPGSHGNRTWCLPPSWRQLLRHRPSGHRGGQGDLALLREAGLRCDNTYWSSREKVRAAAQILDRPDLLPLTSDEIVWEEVRQIEDLGTQPIVQLEVTGTHAYLSEALLHHNTSLCTMANALWQVCRDPDTTLVIFNERVENSKKWLRAIRETVQSNALFQVLYRDMLPPGVGHNDGRSLPRWWKWTDEEIVFQRNRVAPEASITAMGIGTASTGGHWDRCIKDDLVSEDAKNSASVMARVKDWFDSSLPLERPPYKGKDLIVCTPWTYDDVYRYVLEHYSYKLFRRPVLYEDEDTGELRSLLPNKWTVEELLEEQRARPHYFNAQMLCKPAAGKDMAFDLGWVRQFAIRWADGERAAWILPKHYDPEIGDEHAKALMPPPQSVPLWWLNKAILVDPAHADLQSKSERNARHAVVVAGIDPWGRRYILDCWALRSDPQDVIDAILRLAHRWGVTRVGIEKVAAQLVFRHWAQKQAEARGLAITFRDLPPGGRSKDDRIDGLRPGLRTGMIYLNDTQTLHPLVQEMATYPYGRTRDLLDAAAYMDEMLRRPPMPGETETWDELDEDPRVSGRDELTGY